MRILLANPRCHCAGVQRAVRIVELALERFGPPVYVRKEIVHNSHVVGVLAALGAVSVDELDEVPLGSLVIFSAHGVAPAVYREAEQRCLNLIDATCPLVEKVHAEVRRFVAAGCHVILIGQEGHDEVIGTLGHAPEQMTLIENVEQARGKSVPEHDRLAVLTQTTRSMDDTRVIVAALRERFGHLELPSAKDICYATQNRQNAVKAMCQRGIDLLLVVGSRNSSNAARLLEVGGARGMPGFLVDGAEEVRIAWLDGVGTVGVTGGASTPEEVVQAVVRRLQVLGADEVEVCTTADEDTVFPVPAVLRQSDRSLAGSQSSDPR